jgi:ribosomal protein S17
MWIQTERELRRIKTVVILGSSHLFLFLRTFFLFSQRYKIETKIQAGHAEMNHGQKVKLAVGRPLSSLHSFLVLKNK